MGTGELIRVEPPARPVVLKSGGPVLALECIEGTNAVVSWDDGGTRRRRLIPLACLYECRPITEAA